MQLTAKAIADLVNGTIEGNPDVPIMHPAKIEEAREGSITFLANPKYESFIYTTQASAVLVSNTFEPTQPIAATLIRVADVYSTVAQLLNVYNAQQQTTSREVSPKAAIADTATIGEGSSVGAFCVLEEGAVIGKNCRLYANVYVGKNVRIGDNVTLYAGVCIYHDCEIGDHCIVHAHAVIGSDGFGFAPQADRSYQKIPQVGNVVIGNQVEIGANTTIDRATMGSTRIHDGVKLDNLIQVGHNVEIGAHTVIAAQTGIAGSTKIGAYCMIGGQVGFAGHLKIADGTKIQAQSGVGKHVTVEDTALFGSPAIGYIDYVKAYAVFQKLPDIYRKLGQMERKLDK